MIPCPICREDFEPKVLRHGRVSETCSPRCRSKLGRRRQDQHTQAARARATKRKNREARIRAKLARIFGPLTERECRIFAYGEAEGRKDGYNVGVAWGQRHPLLKAAS